MLMIAPMSAGTLTGVPVIQSIHRDPRQGARQSHQNDERIDPALEIDHHQQIDQHNGEDQTTPPSPLNELFMLWICPRNSDLRTARELGCDTYRSTLPIDAVGCCFADQLPSTAIRTSRVLSTL